MAHDSPTGLNLERFTTTKHFAPSRAWTRQAAVFISIVPMHRRGVVC